MIIVPYTYMDTPDDNNQDAQSGVVTPEGILFPELPGALQPETQPQQQQHDDQVQPEEGLGSATPQVFSPPVSEFPPEEQQQNATPSAFTPSTPAQTVTTNSWSKRILLLFFLILLLGGMAIAFRYALVSLGSNQQTESTVVYWGVLEDESVMRPVIDAFQTKNPTIHVQYVSNSLKDYRVKLQTQIAQGVGPDVYRFHNTWVGMLQNDLSPVPPSIITTAQYASTFPKVMNTDLVAGQTIYGIPLMYDGLALLYNEDLLKQAGISDPPATWEQLIGPDGYIKKLLVLDGERIIRAPIALGTTNNIQNFSDIVSLMFLQNGANLVNPNGQESEQTLLYWRKFATPGDAQYSWNESMDDSILAFANGRVAMIFASSRDALKVKELNPALRFKIASFPQLAGNPPVNWASYWVEGVSSKSQNKEASWKFVQFLTSEEGASLLFTSAQKTRLFGEPYARLDLMDRLREDTYLGPIVSMAQSAHSFPLASGTYDGDSGLDTMMISYLKEALDAVAKGTPPAQVLEAMGKGFSDILSSFGLIEQSSSKTQ